MVLLASMGLCDELGDSLACPTLEYGVLEDHLGDALHHLDILLGRALGREVLGTGLSPVLVSAVAVGLASHICPSSASSFALIGLVLLRLDVVLSLLSGKYCFLLCCLVKGDLGFASILSDLVSQYPDEAEGFSGDSGELLLSCYRDSGGGSGLDADSLGGNGDGGNEGGLGEHVGSLFGI